MNTDFGEYQFIDGTRLSSVIEALIFASNEPLAAEKIAGIIAESEEAPEIDEDTVNRVVSRLNDRYEEQGISFHIGKVAGGYAFMTRKKFHYWLSIFQHENAYRKLSQSAIESLAIVAYKQPITKPEIDQIRGVDSSYILRQLMEKALIEVAGRADSPGKPLLYRTTKHFLRHFGINSVNELPKPREIEEILKDDDMAEHRRLLYEQSVLQDDEQETNAPPGSLTDFIEKDIFDDSEDGARNDEETKTEDEE